MGRTIEKVKLGRLKNCGNLKKMTNIAINTGIARKYSGFMIGAATVNPVKPPFGSKNDIEVTTIIIPSEAKTRVKILSSSMQLIY